MPAPADDPTTRTHPPDPPSGDGPAPPPESDPPFPPSDRPGDLGRLGPYRLLRRLGHGGMGAVYLAFDPGLGRKAAVKVMLPKYAAHPAAKARFGREARAAANVKSDHVVTIYAVGEEAGIPYIGMEFLSGAPLDDYLARKGRLTIQQVVRVGREAAEGLAAAHAEGLVHRDIKPANLWLEAPNGRVKILDFGLARRQEDGGQITGDGAVVGSPSYMSPEQAAGDPVDHRTDLFSLGTVLYQLCTGRLPFAGPNVMAILSALANRHPPPVQAVRPDIPPPLADLIGRLLAKDPAARPGSAREVADALAAAERGPAQAAADLPQAVYVPIPVTAFEPSAFEGLGAGAAPPRPPTPAAPRRVGVWAAGGAAVLLAAAGGAFLATRPATPPPPPPDDPPPVVKATPKAAPTKKAAPADPDRDVAAWVLGHRNSTIQTNKGGRGAGAALPAEPFELTAVGMDTSDPVTDPDVARFEGLQHLQLLTLKAASLTDGGVARLGGFPAGKTLTVLHLAFPAPVALAPGTVRRFPNLRSLTLGNVRFDEPLLKAVGGLPDLEELALTNADLAGTAVRGLQGSRVKRVTITPTRSEVWWEHFRDLPALEHLHLYGAGVAAADTFTGLPTCPALHGLVVEGSHFRDAGLEPLGKLAGLRHLSVRYNTYVTDAGLEPVAALDRLETLSLTGLSQVTDAGLAKLTRLTRLKTLEVDRTKVTAGGVAAFRKAVPGCLVRGAPDPKP